MGWKQLRFRFCFFKCSRRTFIIRIIVTMNRNFRSHSNSYINSYIASRLFSCFFLLLLQQVQNDSTIDSGINYTYVSPKNSLLSVFNFYRMHVCLTILNRHVFQSGSYTRTCHKKMCHTYEESSFRQIYAAFLWKISSILNINTGLCSVTSYV